jgi:hypothetical protein
MDLQTAKIELTKLILSIENPTIIEKIKDLLINETSDFWSEMTKEEKDELKLGIKQLNEGQRISFKDFLRKVS